MPCTRSHRTLRCCKWCFKDALVPPSTRWVRRNSTPWYIRCEGYLWSVWYVCQFVHPSVCLQQCHWSGSSYETLTVQGMGCSGQTDGYHGLKSIQQRWKSVTDSLELYIFFFHNPFTKTMGLRHYDNLIKLMCCATKFSVISLWHGTRIGICPFSLFFPRVNL